MEATISGRSSPLLIINSGGHGLQTSIDIVALLLGVFSNKCFVSLDGRVLSVVGLVFLAHIVLINVVETILTGFATLAVLLLLLGHVSNNLATGETATIKGSGALGGTFGILEADSHDSGGFEVIKDGIGDVAVVVGFVANVLFDL